MFIERADKNHYVYYRLVEHRTVLKRLGRDVESYMKEHPNDKDVADAWLAYCRKRTSYEIKDAGDFMERCEDVPNNSIDAVITDPPYPREYLGLYDRLSEFAARVLKPGGSLVAMVGQSYLPEYILRLSKFLNYQWQLSYQTPGGQSAQLWQRKVNTFWKPVLWFVKGEYEGKWLGDVARGGDVVRSSVNDNQKGLHEWQQSESGMMDLVRRFCKPGDIILDPFMGSGTTGVACLNTGRRFIGVDISEEYTATARKRLSSYGVKSITHDKLVSSLS